MSVLFPVYIFFRFIIFKLLFDILLLSLWCIDPNISYICRPFLFYCVAYYSLGRFRFIFVCLFALPLWAELVDWQTPWGRRHVFMAISFLPSRGWASASCPRTTKIGERSPVPVVRLGFLFLSGKISWTNRERVSTFLLPPSLPSSFLHSFLLFFRFNSKVVNMQCYISFGCIV